MTVTNNTPYARNLSLLALTGWVTVYFVEGDTLEAEFVTQDEFNIFLLGADSEPIMIPRHQVKYIQGQPGKQIKEDRFQGVVGQVAPPPREARPEIPPPVVTETPVKKIDDGLPATLIDYPLTPDDDDRDQTLLEEPEPPTPLPAFDEEDEPGTLIMDGPADDQDDATTILDGPIPSEIITPKPTPTWRGDDDEDETMVLSGEVAAEISSAYLVCTEGPYAGQTFDLKSGVTTIGRSSDNVIALFEDKEISRHHAIIVKEEDDYFVQDQNSLNGTFVNNTLVAGTHYLKEGDTVLVGIGLFTFHTK